MFFVADCDGMGCRLTRRRGHGQSRFDVLVTFLQPWPITISVLSTSKPAYCLVRLKPRVKPCAYGSQLCHLGTKTLQMLRSWYVAWRWRCGRTGWHEESRGCCSTSRLGAHAQSDTIIKREMRMPRCAEAVGCIRVT